MSWIEYWNAKPSIYVNARHKQVHYRNIADGIGAHLHGRGRVLDYGCGEALFSHRVAENCDQLYLYDAAPAVREGLEARYSDHESIIVLGDEDLAQLPRGSVDLVIANSVVQYLDEAGLARAIRTWKRILAPGGRVLVADVIPRSVGAATDAIALLRFAGRNGFLTAACAGLLRTFFSDYRRLRGSLGLTQLEEHEVGDFFARQGLKVCRIHPNLGHNQGRMAFIATAHEATDEAQHTSSEVSSGQHGAVGNI
ncbi:MAG: class I SAM-dependent methyltransferase [Hyphomicrobiaceae bacterium]